MGNAEKMVKVKMLATSEGCSDGVNLKEYKKDGEYEVSKGLADCFVSDGFATVIGGENPDAVETADEDVETKVQARPQVHKKK